MPGNSVARGLGNVLHCLFQRPAFVDEVCAVGLVDAVDVEVLVAFFGSGLFLSGGFFCGFFGLGFFRRGLCRGGLFGGLGLGCAGNQAQNHQSCKKQCDEFFHFSLPPVNFMFSAATRCKQQRMYEGFLTDASWSRQAVSFRGQPDGSSRWQESQRAARRAPHIASTARRRSCSDPS